MGPNNKAWGMGWLFTTWRRPNGSCLCLISSFVSLHLMLHCILPAALSPLPSLWSSHPLSRRSWGWSVLGNLIPPSPHLPKPGTGMSQPSTYLLIIIYMFALFAFLCGPCILPFLGVFEMEQTDFSCFFPFLAWRFAWSFYFWLVWEWVLEVGVRMLARARALLSQLSVFSQQPPYLPSLYSPAFPTWKRNLWKMLCVSNFNKLPTKNLF